MVAPAGERRLPPQATARQLPVSIDTGFGTP